ncbi:protein of unknown function [Enterobacter cancerogenus]|nr:protein of unknown function [Enterobacter cancerogenus]
MKWLDAGAVVKSLARQAFILVNENAPGAERTLTG